MEAAKVNRDVGRARDGARDVRKPPGFGRRQWVQKVAVMQLRDIGREIGGVTRERVRQIEAKALNKLASPDTLVLARQAAWKALRDLQEAESSGQSPATLRRAYFELVEALGALDVLEAIQDGTLLELLRDRDNRAPTVWERIEAHAGDFHWGPDGRHKKAASR
jgi:hypothetical protein